MKLVEVQVTKFRNILDSGSVQIQPDVTCLVGKNESGKTAFLHALYRLLPARGNVALSVHDQYPAWLEKRDRLRAVNLDDVRPARATFDLDAADAAAVADMLGEGVLSGTKLGLEKTYGGTLHCMLEANEAAAVRHLSDGLELPGAQAKRARSVKSLAELRKLATELSGKADDADATTAGTALSSKIQEVYGKEDVRRAAYDVLKPRVPTFPELAIHLIALAGESAVIEWYDAPHDRIAVSKRMSEIAVSAFSQSVGGTYRAGEAGV